VLRHLTPIGSAAIRTADILSAKPQEPIKGGSFQPIDPTCI
jgi:hypothetical protein